MSDYEVIQRVGFLVYSLDGGWVPICVVSVSSRSTLTPFDHQVRYLCENNMETLIPRFPITIRGSISIGIHIPKLGDCIKLDIIHEISWDNCSIVFPFVAIIYGATCWPIRFLLTPPCGQRVPGKAWGIPAIHILFGNDINLRDISLVSSFFPISIQLISHQHACLGCETKGTVSAPTSGSGAAPQHALQCRSYSPGKWCQTGAQRTPWMPETTSVCSRSNAGGADNVIPSPDNVSNKNAIDPLLSQGGPGPRVSGNEIHIYNRGKGFVRKHLSPQWSRCLSNIKLHTWNMSNVFNCVVGQKKQSIAGMRPN